MDIFCGNMFYDFMWTLESKKEIVRFCHELLQNFCITRVFLFAKIWNTVELSSNIFCRIFYSISCLPCETQFNFGVLFAPKYSNGRSFYAQGMDSYNNVHCKFHSSFLSLVQFLLYFSFCI